MQYIKKHKFVLFFLVMTISFFTARLTITWDSAHYMSYVEIFERIKPFSSWDIVRGPVFPIFIFLGDKLFGKNAIGMLSLIFIVYLIYCCFIYLISKEIFRKGKYNKIFSIVFILFSVFNPLIFGYFHTLLTEFLAICLMIMSCYFSFRWLYVNSKKKKIIYSCFYILFLPFVYFLKQPYICVIFIPLLISAVITLIHDHSFKNIIYRGGTVFLSCIFLFICIGCWNRILISKNVNMGTGRDSSSLLTGQLLGSISNFDLSVIDDYSILENDMSLSNGERKYAKKIIDSHDKVLLIKVYNDGKLIESDLVSYGENGSSIMEVAMEILSFSIKHPDLLVESYSKNYCAISSVCVIDSSDGIGYWITNRLELVNLYENNSIAYKFLKSGSNLFYLSPEKYESAKFYEQVGGLSITSSAIGLLTLPTNIIYKIVMIFMPIILVLSSIVFFIKKKQIVKDRLYYLGIIFLVSSFLTTLISSSTGQIIDRYSVYCFIPGLIGIIVCVRCMFINIGFRKGKK